MNDGTIIITVFTARKILTQKEVLQQSVMCIIVSVWEDEAEVRKCRKSTEDRHQELFSPSVESEN